MCQVKIGQQWINKEWEDTIIEITQISNSKAECRFKFILIQGDKINNNVLHSINVKDINIIYKLLKDV